jgi:hypothetical protein
VPRRPWPTARTTSVWISSASAMILLWAPGGHHPRTEAGPGGRADRILICSYQCVVWRLPTAEPLAPESPARRWSAAAHRVTMGKTRRSGQTAGEAMPLQLHIAGPQKGVGSFSRRHALAACAGRRRTSIPPATRSAVGCLASRRRRSCPGFGADKETPKGTACPSTGEPAIAIARGRRPIAGPLAGGLAVIGPDSRYRPGDCSPGQFDCECRPLQARFRIDVRRDSRKGLVHQLAGCPRACPPNDRSYGRNVDKPD